MRKQRWQWQFFLKEDGRFDVTAIVLVVIIAVIQLTLWFPFWDMLAGLKSLILTR